MEETMQLKAEVRDKAGSRAAKRVRKESKIPGVVYGHGEEAVAVSLDRHDFIEALHHGHRVFEIDIDGKKDTMMIKDLQYDYLGRDIIHFDLVRVDITEMVEVTVPVEFTGTAAGTLEGGILQEQSNTIDVKCRVNQIPDSLPVSIKGLEIGDSLNAKDIELPEGFELISEPESVLITCTYITEEEIEEIEEEALAEGAEEPELIGAEEAEGEEVAEGEEAEAEAEAPAEEETEEE